MTLFCIALVILFVDRRAGMISATTGAIFQNLSLP